MTTRQARAPISLELIEIASPCTASWDAMRGDDRVRFCDQCKLHVYDISAMSRPEATELIVEHEGRLCVQMYRRADGTVITDDCSAIRKAARRAARIALAASSVVLCAALSPVFLFGANGKPPRTSQASFMPLEIFQRCIAPIAGWFAPPQLRGQMMPVAGGIRPMPPATQPTPQVIMGDVALPATQPTTQPAEDEPR
jgi:hypothetical protein